ncbi:MAG TPA: hypothetical protein VNE21_02210 [Mycobacteriales bacterium]|nr:hypothetical protein [Mycobacteriales bacterium]
MVRGTAGQSNAEHRCDTGNGRSGGNVGSAGDVLLVPGTDGHNPSSGPLTHEVGSAEPCREYEHSSDDAQPAAVVIFARGVPAPRRRR